MTEAEVIDRINSTIKKNGNNAITGDEMNFVLKAIIQLISDAGGTVSWGDIEGTIADQLDLASALNNKVDVVSGKGLSENDFTDALKTKLDGIEAGAEVNVKADWTATSGDAEILNKPTIPNPANFVAKSDYSPAHSVLVQQSGTGSPTAVSIGNNEILGRKSGGGSNIEGLSVSDVKDLLDLEGTNTGDETQSSILAKLEITKLKVTGDQSTTSTTAVDITNLVTGTLPEGKYSVKGSIGVGSTTTGGIKLGITIPSGATMRIRGTDRGTTPNNAVNEIFNTSGVLSTSNFAQVNGDSVVFFEGTITIGATPGVVQFIFAKTTSGTATIYDEATQIKIEKW
jgi:hypothetical protein